MRERVKGGRIKRVVGWMMTREYSPKDSARTGTFIRRQGNKRLRRHDKRLIREQQEAA